MAEPSQALVPNRPRDVGAIVGAAFALYGRYPELFFILATAVIVPSDLIILAATGAGPFTSGDSSAVSQIIVGLAGWVLIGPLVSALHVHAVADVRAGREPELGAVARRGLAVLPVVAATTIMFGLGIFLGLLLLIVPGVILWFRWFVATQAAAIEHEGWLPALRSSRALTRGNYTHIFVFMIFLFAITGVANTVLTIALDNRTTAATFIIGMVAHLFTASFTALTTALLYFDLVARRDTTTAGAPAS